MTEPGESVPGTGWRREGGPDWRMRVEHGATDPDP